MLCQRPGILGPLDPGDGPSVTGKELFVPAAWPLGFAWHGSSWEDMGHWNLGSGLPILGLGGEELNVNFS